MPDQTVGAWFPAWHLIEHPGIRIDCGGSAILPETRAAQTLIGIVQLIEIEKHGYSATLVSARSRLRDMDPDMFAFYMSRRDVEHR